MEYDIYSYSTKGTFHKINEDQYAVSDNFLIVADGMGGESDGDVASRIAVESIVAYLSNNILEISSEAYIREISRKAISCADSNILDYIGKNPESFGMGTTVLLAVRKDDTLFISWCGDSHCYVYNNGCLNSITKDHSYVQQLIDSDQISVDESFTHPDNNLITRFVGGGAETCIPDFCSHKIEESELVILCSDGLSGYCRQRDIAETVASNSDMARLPERLAELAIKHGSDDDITIILLVPPKYTPAPHSLYTLFTRLKKLIS